METSFLRVASEMLWQAFSYWDAAENDAVEA